MKKIIKLLGSLAASVVVVWGFAWWFTVHTLMHGLAGKPDQTIITFLWWVTAAGFILTTGMTVAVYRVIR